MNLKNQFPVSDAFSLMWDCLPFWFEMNDAQSSMSMIFHSFSMILHKKYNKKYQPKKKTFKKYILQ